MPETKKNKGGRPRVDATPVTVRIPPDLLDWLDTYRATLPDAPSRPETIREVVRAMRHLIEKDR